MNLKKKICEVRQLTFGPDRISKYKRLFTVDAKRQHTVTPVALTTILFTGFLANVMSGSLVLTNLATRKDGGGIWPCSLSRPSRAGSK